jgi:phenylalanyl-tRNA synthetase beta chain
MKVLYNWVKEFVELPAPPEDLRTRLSLAGIAIDSLEDSLAGPVLDAEITANRPDCLGHYGIAREAAAIYRRTLKPVPLALEESVENVSRAVRVEIEAPDLCGRFTARVLSGVKVQPSPDWLGRRLQAVGQNSINNVVDVTNYVMFELGHPLHAYDLDKITGRQIVVRRAIAGEKLRTLDGVERRLTEGTCVIADAFHPIGLGGILGGAESEIGYATRHILLESAWFDPLSVRRASKLLGLRTEASYRFERGADPEMPERASRRAAELIRMTGGGEILSGVVDVYPARAPQRKLELARKELLRVMGADVPDRDLEEILSALGFHPVRIDSNRGSTGSLMAVWECHRPSWRPDVSRGVDLIEEVARHYGYDKFPSRLPAAKRPASRLPHADARDRLCEHLQALGYQEIVEIPIVDSARDEIFRPTGVTPAKIGNPLAEDASVMRSSGIVSMIRALEWNLNHGQRNLRLFEIGKRYELKDGEPVETSVLTLGATGLAREKSVYETEREFSFADLKGDLDQISALAVSSAWTPGGPAWLARGRAASISTNGTPAGIAGQLARRVADSLKLRQEIFLAEFHLDPLLRGIEAARAALRFQPLPRFPAVERDFSLLLSDGVTFWQVQSVLGDLDIPELESVEAADLFRGGKIPAGKYSLMIRVKFQSPSATLTDAQVSELSSRVVSALEQRLDATLRAS